MSYITVDAAKVAQRAQEVIDEILELRKKHDEKKIAKVMERGRKVSFFSKKRVPLSRDEAIAFLNKNTTDVFGSPSWRSWVRYDDYNCAQHLLILAKNGDPVSVNSFDAEVLWG